jgi:NCAIR mutase (PurE)-related protein
MTQSKHTPTPWVVTTDSSGFTAINNHDNFRSDFPLATMCKGMTQGEANAAFIVKAVNNHEALVSALEKFVHAAIEKHQDVYVADEVIKDPSYLKKYAADYDFAWPQYIYYGVDALEKAGAA